MEKPLSTTSKRLIITGLAVFLFFYISVIAVAPLRKLVEFKRAASSDTVFYQKYQPINNERQLFDLSKLKAFNEAQVALARKDTFGMIVNLRDSTLSIVLKGVRVHSTKITKIQSDRFFRALNPVAYVKLFSKPLRVLNEHSTIIKEPVIVKQAPKTPEEAISSTHMPDSLIHDNAYIFFQLEHGFNLVIMQNNLNTAASGSVLQQRRKDKRWARRQNTLCNLVHWRKARYHPMMTVQADAGNIISFYRALPHHALIIVAY